MANRFGAQPGAGPELGRGSAFSSREPSAGRSATLLDAGAASGVLAHGDDIIGARGAMVWKNCGSGETSTVRDRDGDRREHFVVPLCDRRCAFAPKARKNKTD